MNDLDKVYAESVAKEYMPRETNKVRQIIDKVDLIQSVDSIKLASEISKQALKINKNCD